MAYRTVNLVLAGTLLILVLIFSAGSLQQSSAPQAAAGLLAGGPTHNHPQVCGITFSDVAAGNIFATYIYDLACAGVVNGIGGGRFGPSLQATRGQFARMVAVGFALPAYTPASPSFSDVPSAYFAYGYIETMVHAGVSSGYQTSAQCSPAGVAAPCYLPNHNISRAEAVALMMRAAGYSLTTPATPSFLDVPASFFAYAQIETAYSLGIVGGLNGNFRPNAPIRRDELSRVLDLGILYRSGTPTPGATPTPRATATPPPGVSYYRGVNLSGGEFGGNYPGVYGVDYRYPLEADFTYFSSKGLNFIRLPLQWERVQRSLNTALNADELTQLDAVVGFAQARGMSIMFEPQNFDRYQVGGVDYLVGSAQVPDSAFADFWRRMAQHFAAYPNVSYNLMNEPHDTGGHWPISAQAAVNAIRLVDSTHTIYIPGDCWQGAWTWQDCNADLNISDPQNNIVYDAHQYFDSDGSGAYLGTYESNGGYPNVGADRLQPFTAWLTLHNFKGFVSEYGVPRTDPRWFVVLNNFLGAMDAANLGGTYWSAGWWEDSYLLSVQPWANDGTDKPQLPTLLQHRGRQR